MTALVPLIDINTDTWGDAITKINNLIPLVPDDFVTSVNITPPTGMSVSGGPITDSGTLTLSYSAGYVPYTQAERNKIDNLGTISTWSPTGTANNSTYLRGDGVWETPVTSIGMTVPTGLSVSGSPVTGNGTFAITYASGYQGFTTTLKNKIDSIETGAQVNTITSVAGKTGAVTLSKGDVGLGNVDNTSDANKPVSTATLNALNNKVSKDGDTMSGDLDMDGNALLNVDWSSSNLPSGLPVGAVLFDPRGAGWMGFLELNGSSFDTDVYPDLALLYPSGVLPDFTDRVPRGAGPLAGAAGTTQEDALQDHVHSLLQVASGGTGAQRAFSYDHKNVPFDYESEGGDLSYTSKAGGTDVKTGDETRVKSVIGKWYIKAFDGYVNPSQVNIDNALSGKLNITGGTLTGSLAVTGDITATGNISAYSDERLKSNIERIDNALERVQKINGVFFDINDRKSTGVIAQNVAGVLPEVISEDSNGLLSVAYGNMIGILIEAIKELKSEVDQLRKSD